MLLDPGELRTAKRAVDEPGQQRVDGGVLGGVQVDDAAGHPTVPNWSVGQLASARGTCRRQTPPAPSKSPLPIIPSQTETEVAYSQNGALLHRG